MKIIIAADNKAELDRIFNTIMDIAALSIRNIYKGIEREYYMEQDDFVPYWMTYGLVVCLGIEGHHKVLILNRTETSVVLEFKLIFKAEYSIAMINSFCNLFPNNIEKYD